MLRLGPETVNGSLGAGRGKDHHVLGVDGQLDGMADLAGLQFPGAEAA